MFAQRKIFLVSFVFLIGCVRLLSKGQASTPVMIKSWKDEMKEEWFLQVGERCDIIGDQMDHFAMFYTLGQGGGIRQGLVETTARNLASRRCLKEKLSKNRKFECLNGICDCKDPETVWEPETQSCRKFDNEKCRRTEECLSGYICALVAETPPGTVLTRTVDRQRQDLVTMQNEMNMFERTYLERQSEDRRRKYIKALISEGQQIAEFVDRAFGVTANVSREPALSDTMMLDKLLNDGAQHPLIRKNIDVIVGDSYFQVLLYLQGDNQVLLKPPPTEQQRQRAEAWRDRTSNLTDLIYLFKNSNDRRHMSNTDTDLEMALDRSRLRFFDAKRKFNIAAGKVCHCGGVGSDSNKCVINKVDRIPRPPKINLMRNSTEKNLADIFKPSWPLLFVLLLFLFVEIIVG